MSILLFIFAEIVIELFDIDLACMELHASWSPLFPSRDVLGVLILSVVYGTRSVIGL